MKQGQLLEAKEKLNKTYKEIAARAKVSESSVQRVIKDIDGKDSNWRLKSDVIRAMGLSLDAYYEGEIVPLEDKKEPDKKTVEDVYRSNILYLKKMVRLCLIITITSLVILISLLIFDFMNPDVGYFRAI